MSISDEIQDLVAKGILVPVRPRLGFGARRIRRYMFLTKELNAEIEKEIAAGDTRFAELEADLVAFLVSPAISKDYLKQLIPPSDGVWEIRCHADEPTMRVFGQFAARNVFIAMGARYRGDLGSFDDPRWTYEINRARRIWKDLFPSCGAKVTTDAHKLFDGAVHEKYYDD